MSGFEDIFHTIHLPPLLVLPLIVIGLLLAFFGRVIFYYLLFMYGGILIGGALALVFYLTGHGSTDVFLIGLGGFLGGGLIAVFAFRAVLFLIGAFIGFIAGYLAFPNYPYVAGILAGVGGAILLILFDVALPIVTAIQGGSLIGFCLLLSGMDSTLSAATSVLVAFIGAAFQLFGPVRNMRQRGRSLESKRASKKKWG